MNFNFSQQYQSWSNIELLKIVKRPEDYQPAAVEAATAILATREVTDQEHAAVDFYFQQLERGNRLAEETLVAHSHSASDFLEHLSRQADRKPFPVWLIVLLSVIGLNILFHILILAQIISVLVQCYDCAPNAAFWVGVVELPFLVVLFLLLFHRKQAGWVLLFGSSFFYLGLTVLVITTGYGELFTGPQSPVSMVVRPLVLATIMAVIWKQPIANLFSVSEELKRKTLGIAAAIVIIIMLVTIGFLG